ncbi:alpha/beta fold hydrolase [Kitasatospora sp. NPDC056138]|uniref:alpha/beta fold hydrolase n=1 Tax=Kitasatospora sp. NPDC056138 TaxID=3345724 RepID=UPI0035D5C9F3
MAHSVLVAGTGGVAAVLAGALAAATPVPATPSTAALPTTTLLTAVPPGPATAGQNVAGQAVAPGGFPAALAQLRAAEVWWVAPGDPGPADLAVGRALFAALPALDARALRVVTVGPTSPPDPTGPPGPPGSDRLMLLLREAAVAALAAGVPWLALRTPVPVAPEAAALGIPAGGPHLLLDALHAWQADLEERCPGYPSGRAFRLVLPSGAAVPLLSSAQAAERLRRLAEEPDGGPFRTLDAPPVGIAGLLPELGAAYGLRLEPTGSERELDAVELSLHRRLAPFRAFTTACAAASTSTHPSAALPGRTGPPPGEPPPGTHRGLLRAVRSGLTTAARRPAPPESVRSTELGGAGLVVRSSGPADGPVLVLINALGQERTPWARLTTLLAAGHRVVTWDVRGTGPVPRPFTLDDQLDDLAGTLRLAGVAAGTPVHLVGWCTGAKVATAFQRHGPAAVASLVLLNPSFRLDGPGREQDTPYESNLDAVCRAVVRAPARAGRLLRLFGPSAVEGTDGPPEPWEALTAVSPALRESVRRPFLDRDSLVRYAGQLLDFWAYDSAPDAAGVDVPVLFVTAEHDEVASPGRARAELAHYPYARHVELLGATHYCLHDRADLVARLIGGFVRDPGCPGADGEELRWER